MAVRRGGANVAMVRDLRPFLARVVFLGLVFGVLLVCSCWGRCVIVWASMRRDRQRGREPV